MKVILFSVLVVFSSLLYVNSAPIFVDDDDVDLDLNFPEISVDCSKFGCPSGSTACSKCTTTSKDKQLVNEEIKCYDSNGHETKNEIKSSQNPYPNNSVQSGYEFYGSYNERSPSITTNNSENVDTFNKK